jgi:hypothetical protein
LFIVKLERKQMKTLKKTQKLGSITNTAAALLSAGSQANTRPTHLHSIP